MNIQRIPEYLLRWAVTVGGIALALYLSKSVGDGKIGLVAGALFGIVGIILVLVVREKIWVLVPIFWALYARMPVFSLPFNPRELITLYVVLAFCTLIAFKVLRRPAAFSFIDVLFLVNCVWLLIALIRNPVGLEATESVRVGGRPYFEAFIGGIALWILGRSEGPLKLIRALPFLVVGALGIVFVANGILYFRPELTPYFTHIYSGFDTSAFTKLGNIDVGSAGDRYEIFRDIGKYMSVLLCAYSYPPHLLLPLRGRFYAMVGTGVCLLLSGFRSFLMYAGGMFALGTYFRRGVAKAAWFAVIAMFVVYIFLLGHGTVYRLPYAAQRALSFLPEALIPNKLDPLAVQSGTSSTNWRVEMWILALTTNRYIDNHLLGDGFGFTKLQYNAISAIQSERRALSDTETQETMATVGDFHSGPVSSIRVVGYIGLALTLALLVGLAIRAGRLIRRVQGTKFLQPTLFFCLPIVFEPFWYVFIFGGHAAVIPFAGFSLGMMKMLEASFANWQLTQGSVNQAGIPGLNRELAPSPALPAL